MDQDSFRRLLQTPRPSGSATQASNSRSSLSAPKPKHVKEGSNVFKPRKLKKQTEGAEPKYRDRAAERRIGEGNDYAQVEAVLEDFEQQTAQIGDRDEVEKRRRYLGGDSDHSILVKGLDVALLEQNRARAALSPEDDDELEKAFLQGSGSVKSSAPVTVPKKRTREDLIRELKEKRLQGSGGEAPSTKTQEAEARLLEDAKKAGKFKPIGLNPIAEGNTTKKKSKAKDGEGRKKKKQKVDEADQARPIKDKDVADRNPPNGLAHPPTSTVASVPQEGVPELDEDLEIFAGVGDYQGIDIPSDEDEETSRQKIPLPADDSIAGPALPPRAKWFDDLPRDPPLPPAPLVVKAEQKAAELPPPPKQDEGEDHLDIGQLKSLAPLESSAVPSIKDLLAMDEAAQLEEKRRKRKEKKKGGGGGEASKKDVSASVKADRDYKRLQSHLEKKAGSSSAKG